MYLNGGRDIPKVEKFLSIYTQEHLKSSLMLPMATIVAHTHQVTLPHITTLQLRVHVNHSYVTGMHATVNGTVKMHCQWTHTWSQ